MKTPFLMLGAAALMLAACGQKTEPAPDPEPAPAMEPAPATTDAAPADSVRETGTTGTMQPIDPPPTLPEDPAGENPSTGTSPPQR